MRNCVYSASRHGFKATPAVGTVRMQGIGRADVCTVCRDWLLAENKPEVVDFREGFDITRHSGEWTGD